MEAAEANQVADLAVNDLEMMSWCLISNETFCANAILTNRGLWIRLRIFLLFGTRREASDANPCIGSPAQIRLRIMAEGGSG